MHTVIQQYIERGYTVVTPTTRLARVLRRRDTAVRRERRETVWETPDILPWEVWIKRLWNACMAHQTSPLLLLNATQAGVVWHEIVADSDAGRASLYPASLAKRSYAALQDARRWRLAIFPPKYEDDLHNEARAFRAWVRVYERRCGDEGWLDAVDLIDRLIPCAPRCATRYAKKICLFGFDEVTPAEESLLRAFADAGSEIHRTAPPTCDGEVVHTLFPDDHAEQTAVARWAYRALEASTVGDSEIGIIAPQLATCRNELMHCLDEVLEPGGILSAGDRQRLYHLSLGQPLLDYPMIHAAFAILELSAHKLPFETISTLLRSPFIDGADMEMAARAELDADLRERGDPMIEPETWHRHLAADARWLKHCGVWIASLNRWHRVAAKLPRSQTHRDWANAFAALLKAWGWPGEQQLTSDEFQTLTAWHELLDHFASLDLVTGTLEQQRAQSILKRLAGERIYQTRTGEDAPIQIMGLLEASGMTFRRAWIMGLHEDVFPPVARPNPFIPQALQRQREMPHSSSEREYAYTRMVAGRLAQAAPDVTFSTSLRDGDLERQASRLITVFPERPPPSDGGKSYTESLHAAGNAYIECLSDDDAPALDKTKAHGGAGLFQDQAACPFRAFAKHRLGARQLTDPELGLNARDRGVLAHECLHRFWRRVRSSAALGALNEDALHETITDSVAATLKQFTTEHSNRVTPMLLDIETDRLQTLLADWLDREKERAVFEVLECESRCSVTVSGLTVETRIDRIDKLADGSLVIIDYKTAENMGVNDWWGERPKEPQLPLYATGQTSVVAVTFARLKRGRLGFIGLANAADPAAIPGVIPFTENADYQTFGDWQTLLDFWRRNLSRLADEFSAGRAPVAPLRKDTCKYCDLAALCRIHERRP